MNLIQHRTGKHGPSSREPIQPLYLVLHDTEGSFPGDLRWLADVPSYRSGASVHYLVAPDGDVYQLLDDRERGWHAGRSTWAGLVGMNDYSIGIEISHISAGKPPYPAAQLHALDELIWLLFKRFPFRGPRPIAHREISPGRKTDPQLFMGDYTWERVAARLFPQEDDMTPDQDQRLKRLESAVAALQTDVDNSQRAVSFRETIQIAILCGDWDRAKTLADAAEGQGVRTGFSSPK